MGDGSSILSFVVNRFDMCIGVCVCVCVVLIDILPFNWSIHLLISFKIENRHEEANKAAAELYISPIYKYILTCPNLLSIKTSTFLHTFQIVEIYVLHTHTHAHTHIYISLHNSVNILRLCYRIHSVGLILKFSHHSPDNGRILWEFYFHFLDFLL